MKEYNATLIDYGEGKGKLVVESQFGKVTFAVKADSHMWVELERPNGEWVYHRFDHDYECSICNLRLDEDEDMPAGDLWDYCPRCGARCLPMVERRAEDEND